MHGCLVRLMCRFEQCDRLVRMTAEATIQVVVILHEEEQSMVYGHCTVESRSAG